MLTQDPYETRELRSDRRIAKRLKEAKQKREDVRLKALVLSKQGELSWIDPKMARALGIPISTYAQWVRGGRLPTQYHHLIEPALAGIATWRPQE